MKKLKFCLYVVIIVLTGYMTVTVIQNSYALFETEGIAVVEQKLGKWVITVNDVGVTGTTKEFIVDNFKYITNEYTANNKIAPGGNCYFDIVIDANDTDVSVKYVIDLDFSMMENYAFIETEVIDLTDGDVVKTGIDEYTGILDLEEIKKGQTKTLRVNLTWVNDEANNEKDSELGLVEDSKFIIPVNVRLTQYTSEEIVPYIE